MASQSAVALIITVRNEAHSIGELLEALAAQTRQPAELIVVDGGSTDGTSARAAAFAARLPQLQALVAPGSNIAAGRNHGIAASRSPLVAITDAGCRPPPEWLAELVAPLEAGADWDLAGGRVVPLADTHLEACLGRCSLAFVQPIGGARLQPTARCLAFRREVWQRRPFPPQLDYGEDLAFITRAVEAGFKLCSAPRAVMYWRPRRSYAQVAGQFYHYTLWMAWAGLGLGGLARTAAQSFGGLFLAGLGLAWPHWLPWALLAGLAAAYLARKARQGCFDVPGWRTLYRVPLALGAIHLGTMAGLAAGLWTRLTTGRVVA